MSSDFGSETRGKGRHDPDKVKYFQSLADLTRVFWEFHKHRIREGEIKFAYDVGSVLLQVTPMQRSYDPTNRLVIKMYEDGLGHEGPFVFDIIDDFETSIFPTIGMSWNQFAQAYGHEPVKKNEQLGVFREDVVGRYPDFLQSVYVRDLFATTDKLFVTQSRLKKEGSSEIATFSLVDIVSVGIAHALTDSVQLVRARLHGKIEEGKVPVVASKVSGVDHANAQYVDQKIGISCHGRRASYDLFDDSSSSGVDMELLRRYGHGKALGCPANMKVSADTRTFLEYVTGREIKNTFVYQLANAIDRYVDKRIIPWMQDDFPKLAYAEKVKLVIPKFIRRK